MPSPAQLSYELRKARTDDMQRRRWIVGLSLVGTAAGAVVGLYQMGMLKRLPDLPVKPFDATKVDKQPYAYKRLQTPDALLMLASYAATAVLAGAGGKDRARDNPTLPILLAAKTLYDFATAVKLGTEEWQETRALCGYCQAATVASLVSAGLAMPEAAKAVREVFAIGLTEQERRERERRLAARPPAPPRVAPEDTARRPKNYTRPLKGQQPVHA
ncbi:MAG TPA: vitamin K epoxide reductase family protein [Beijerinckiaceae bacterium]|jgi:uncharacterized membrane protein